MSSVADISKEIRKAGKEWIRTRDQMPPSDVEVQTKIHDERGCRNETTLKFFRGLWFFPDLSMYVYYSPTHWRPL